MLSLLNISEICSAQAIDPNTILVELSENHNSASIIDTSNAFLNTYSWNITPETKGKQIKAKAACSKQKLTRTILDPLLFAKKSAYFQREDEIIFLLPEERARIVDIANNPIFLATDFNNWYDATKFQKFQLKYTTINEFPCFAISLPVADLPDHTQFKFVTASGTWIAPEIDTKNKVFSSWNTCNYQFDKSKTGNHLMALSTETSMLLCDKMYLSLSGDEIAVDVLPWLFSCYTDKELGAHIENGKTFFRVFIPRAHAVRLLLCKDPFSQPLAIDMQREYDNTWSTAVGFDLHGQFYHYQALFFDSTDWNSAQKILDPYAKAAFSREGPGIILNQHTFLPLRDNFVAQHIRDDVILEVHLRDLLQHAPIKLTEDQRLSFNGLTKWLTKKHCYLRELGANAIEFQPIQEVDAEDKYEYHWGYMPTNYFSPASTYASSPEKAPMEFKKFVNSCHGAGLAIILDVVYNHVGYPNHLHGMDPDYFFRKNDDGSLQNFSGCGNDLRTESPMVQRLIIDSLSHFIKTYNIDGFRFDLAELLGQEFLWKLEHELRLIKNDIQLIYEPWSFRENIGTKLHHSTASAWNDEYRDFIAKYVHGSGNYDGIKYFLGGSLDFRAKFSHQSINYIASHDDRCWVDKITENSGHNGSTPTENDVKRTHLALAIMMMSLGVPMLVAGQDMLSSKNGHNNTYKMGDINALNYDLLEKNHDTHRFFKQWIKFRLSKRGAITRPCNHVTDKYVKFFHSYDSSAIGALYNADRSLDTKQVFFAINPHNYISPVILQNFELKNFRKLSDENKFFNFSKKFSENISNGELLLNPLSLILYIE